MLIKLTPRSEGKVLIFTIYKTLTKKKNIYQNCFKILMSGNFKTGQVYEQHTTGDNCKTCMSPE